MGDERHEDLKLVDRFNDLLVYAFVTAGESRFLFLHDQRNEENVRDFFHEVHELYLRIQLARSLAARAHRGRNLRRARAGGLPAARERKARQQHALDVDSRLACGPYMMERPLKARPLAAAPLAAPPRRRPS